MRKQVNILSAIMIAVLCGFSLFSKLNINAFIVCGVCVAYAFAILVINKGKLIVNKTLLIWFCVTLLMFIYLYLTTKKINVYYFLFLSLVLFAVAITTVWDKIDVKMMMTVMTVFSSILIVTAVMEKVFGLRIFGSGKLSNGLAQHANLVSLATIVVFIYALWMMEASKPIYKYLLLFVAVVGILVAGERSNLLLIPLAVIVVYYLYGKKNKAFKVVRILIIVGVAIFLFFALRDILSQYRVFGRVYETIDSYLAGDSMSIGRDRMRDSAMDAWLRKPIFGNGVFYFFYNNKGILDYGKFTHAHNFILETLCDCGIVGLVIILIPISIPLIQNFKLVKKPITPNSGVYKFTLAFQIYFLLDSLFHVTFYSTYMISFYFICIALFYVKKSQDNEDQELYYVTEEAEEESYDQD